MAIEVWIDENNHTADEGEGRYRHGDFDTGEAAIAECRRIVDEFLESQRTADISGEELFRIYSLFAEEPYVVGPESTAFSARDYARQRCGALCEPG